MDDATTLCSLAHELGHAHYGDPPGHHGAHEIRADRFAARLLINSTDYATTEAIYGPHPNVLAHELGHAAHRDTPTGNGHFDQRQERRADEYAAQILINPHDFEAAAIWHHGHLPAIADELEVTQHILKTWQSMAANRVA